MGRIRPLRPGRLKRAKSDNPRRNETPDLHTLPLKKIARRGRTAPGPGLNQQAGHDSDDDHDPVHREASFRMALAWGAQHAGPNLSAAQLPADNYGQVGEFFH